MARKADMAHRETFVVEMGVETDLLFTLPEMIHAQCRC